MKRREFLEGITASAWLAAFGNAFAAGTKDSAVGKPWKGWKRGEFQVHFIYTGVGESMFYIFPDGTTMLLDCGDHAAHARGKLAVPILPDMSRHSGEWIARYVQRVNPQGKDVDYMFISHFHDDHMGTPRYHAGKTSGRGEDYYLSGFAQAAEFLNFKKWIDRGWPTYDDPKPCTSSNFTFAHYNMDNMRAFQAYMKKKGGIEFEKFRVGAVNQIAPQCAKMYSDFSVTNVCGNGRILMRDGTIKDLYPEPKPKKYNENGMSLGMVFRYGKFSFFTGGDFSDRLKINGKVHEIEDDLGPELGHIDVCKVNHHGHYAMTEGFVRGVTSRFYVSCVWDQLHNNAPSMARMSSRKFYPGERTICPGIMPKERRVDDAGTPWMDDVAKASYEGGHIVLNVSEGGADYSLTYLTAKDESMLVTSVLRP